MSRKHYVEVAAILKAAQDHGQESRDNFIAVELALMFKRDNARFNAGRFFQAAGFDHLTNTRQGLS